MTNKQTKNNRGGIFFWVYVRQGKQTDYLSSNQSTRSTDQNAKHTGHAGRNPVVTEIGYPFSAQNACQPKK